MCLPRKMSKLKRLSPQLQLLATVELNEVPERLNADLEAFREWAHQQSYIRTRTTDQFLVAFLRGCKHSLEKAKSKLIKYYSLQAGLPEVFRNRFVDDDKTLEIIRMGVILRIPLPEDYEGPCMTIIRATIYDTERYKFADIIRVGTMFAEIMMLEDNNSVICGYVEIMDMIGVGAQHLFHLPPGLIRRLATFAEEATPMRQRGTHFINVPPPFEVGFRTIKTFFPEKATKKIFAHSTGSETLYDHVPKIYLPVEYGGENGTIPDIIAAMEKKLMSYKDYFIEGANLGVSETLQEERCSKENTTSFGTEGSFRKLSID